MAMAVNKLAEITMETSTLNDVADSAHAPLLQIPRKPYWVVEFPGFVQSTENALATLGGTAAIFRVFNSSDQQLELYLRRGDPFSHPINGDVVKTANLLVRITRRRRRQEKKDRDESTTTTKRSVVDAWTYQTKILGIIEKTVRFRGIADYQWIMPQTDPIVHLRRDLTNLSLEKIKGFQFSGEEVGMDNLRNFPPPNFSRLEWPLSYDYKQNPAVVKIRVQQPNGQSTVRLVNRSKQDYVPQHMMRFDGTESVPTQPPPGLARFTKNLDKELIKLVHKLFQERPLWTRVGLTNNLPPRFRRFYKRVLPLSAYFISSGAFRWNWARYGVDPTISNEYRFYQAIDLRKEVPTGVPLRAKRRKITVNLGLGNNVTKTAITSTVSDDDISSSTTAKYMNHIFDGIHLTTDVSYFQLIDLTDPVLYELVHSLNHVNETFHPIDGWYHKDLFPKLRKRMKQRRYALTTNTPYEPPSENEMDFAASNSDSDDEYLIEGANQRSARQYGKSYSSTKAGELETTIAQRVKRLERHLQQHRHGTPNDQQMSNVTEWMDMFADDMDEVHDVDENNDDLGVESDSDIDSDPNYASDDN